MPVFPNVSLFLTTCTLSFVFLLHAAEELAEVKRQDELDKGNKYVMAASKRLRNLNKRLRAIDDMKKDAAAGKVLNDQQKVLIFAPSKTTFVLVPVKLTPYTFL